MTASHTSQSLTCLLLLWLSPISFHLCFLSLVSYHTSLNCSLHLTICTMLLVTTNSSGPPSICLTWHPFIPAYCLSLNYSLPFSTLNVLCCQCYWGWQWVSFVHHTLFPVSVINDATAPILILPITSLCHPLVQNPHALHSLSHHLHQSTLSSYLITYVLIPTTRSEHAGQKCLCGSGM